MNLDQALQTFLEESRDLLQNMEEELLRLEIDPHDSDCLNAIFRAAHTIKGSAGLFGLEPIVAFTHVVENLLDQMRAGQIEYSPGLAALLLKCRDHIAELVDCLAEQGVDPEPALLASGEAVLDELRVHMGEQQDAAVPATSKVPLEKSGGGPVVDSETWHLSLRFGRDVLRNGMDPLSFIRYLKTLGTIVHITTLPDALPTAQDMDPETCYLGFEIDFQSETDKDTLAGVFEFVREDSLIHILPPYSKISEYVELIQKLPEDDARLGEILVASGALTQEELEEGLRIQQQNQTSDAGPAEVNPLGEILVEQKLVQPELIEAALEKQTRTKEAKARESRYIRIQADKLDQLINRVGELVIAGASTSLLAHQSGDRALMESTQTVARLVEEIRDSALQLRMVPIGETFNRFQRVVRDVSRELGKDIQLVISGAETELDKTVVEKIGDPLTHLVRNSMDHGIESAELRRQQGKPAQGTVRLNAYHDSGSIVIEVGDDGGGLKREKLLKKALEKGIITAQQSLSDQEIHHLIFEPGFSTASQVTNLSGRGVGMDVVKRNIEALRGTVEVESEPQLGTTIRIRLPLTLAIIDGFLTKVGSAAYVVPLDTVVECVELTGQDRLDAQERNYINLRGEVLPFIRLREQFREPGQSGRRENLVVVNYAGQKAGLVVDELLGEFQTVIKPLGKLFGQLKGISGSTILGSGEIALILDVSALVQLAVNTEARLAARQSRTVNMNG